MHIAEVKNERDARTVALQWDNGSKQAIPYATLRAYCPCAHCQGHGAGPKKWVAPPADLRLSGIAAVGLYALKFQWSDGHGSGIYSFEYLRELGQ